MSKIPKGRCAICISIYTITTFIANIFNLTCITYYTHLKHISTFTARREPVVAIAWVIR